MNQYLGVFGDGSRGMGVPGHDLILIHATGSRLDEIQTLLLEHGFGVGRVEVLTSQFHVPTDLQSVPLSRLSMNGFKLTAWRKP